MEGDFLIILQQNFPYPFPQNLRVETDIYIFIAIYLLGGKLFVIYLNNLSLFF